MSERPVFPPLLKPFAVSSDLDPFERGIKLAEEGADAGTVLWSIGQDVCACAVVLAPEQPREQSLPIVLVAMLGLADGLGALLPPAVAVTFGWPDRVEVNGALVGGVRCASAPTEDPEAVPDWLATGFHIAMRGPWSNPQSPGDRPRTSLAEEGCGEVSAIDLLEEFGRHFLSWINRWQEEGMRPVQQAWLRRATGLGKEVEVRVGQQVRTGIFEGLGETGAMRLVKGGVAQTIALDEAVRVPTWSI
jgi:BirA family transcriptional regulator, biotin operon repressor / biotin---[acetyl-CoA-carboxylase] ligase